MALSKTNKITPMQEMATVEYTSIIGQAEYDITNLVLNDREIIPTISAGMIPIKWNGEQWVITTKEDIDWYDYANGKPAYMMLNDGYYKSELEQGVTEEQLMQNSVGNDALVVPGIENNNPSIYMYIPRFAYNNDGQILYIKQGCSVAGNYTIPEIFTHKTQTLEASLSGIWVEYDTNADVATKVSNMQGENNKYGFIANTVGVNANNETSYVTTIEKSHLDSKIKKPINQYRTILKITNSNKLEPIMANAKYDENIEKVKIEVTYSINGISKIIDSKGNILSENSLTADTGDEVIGNKVYTYVIIDNLGNQKQITTSVSGLDVYIIENEADLKFFRDAVNSGKTTAKTKAYQIADVTMNEGKFTTNLETGEVTITGSIESWTPIGSSKSYGRKILWK